MKHISILLNLNREVHLALLQQDNTQKQIEKAVEIINEQKQLILITQKEYAMAIVQQANSFPALSRKEQSDSPLAKFLQAFKHTISKVVERVGHYI